MNEENKDLTFDDLFENKDQIKVPKEPNRLTQKKAGLMIGLYFLFMLVIVSILAVVFLFVPGAYKNPNDRMIDTIKRSNKYEAGYVPYRLLSKIQNEEKMGYIVMPDQKYIFIFTDESKAHFGDESQVLYYVNSVYSQKDTALYQIYTKHRNATDDAFFETYGITPYYNEYVSHRVGQELSIGGSTFLNFSVYVMMIATFIPLTLKLLKKEYDSLPKKVAQVLSMIGIGYLLVIAGNVVSQVLVTVFKFIFNQEVVESVNQGAVATMLKGPYAALMIVNVVIFAPIIEELIFRKAFFSLIKNKWVALVVSSLVFGLIHVTSEPSIQLLIINIIPYAVMGVVFGYAYIRSDENILIPISIHALSNLLATILIFFSM